VCDCRDYHDCVIERIGATSASESTPVPGYFHAAKARWFHFRWKGRARHCASREVPFLGRSDRSIHSAGLPLSLGNPRRIPRSCLSLSLSLVPLLSSSFEPQGRARRIADTLIRAYLTPIYLIPDRNVTVIVACSRAHARADEPGSMIQFASDVSRLGNHIRAKTIFPSGGVGVFTSESRAGS